MSPETVQNIMEALGIMGKGMLGIFVVIGVIALIVYALTKLSSSKNRRRDLDRVPKDNGKGPP